ncbi:MAG: Gldg family protein [Bacteroidales bacterium]|jgi:gliding-associated putative ABC transporter substrate-binding component GldG|nr:Gldg family protein [Bacteroidales bacterium]
MSKKYISEKNISLYLILLAGIFVLLNILGSRYFFRGDFTADKRYTLSTATKNILVELEDPISVTAYFSEGLPPQIERSRTDFQDLLTEYRSVSRGNVHYEFVNPNKNEFTEQIAEQAGIRPVLINTREKDQVAQKKAYLGAVVSYGDQNEVIPLIQEGAAMEHALSMAIKKLTTADRPLIGWIQGHGEPQVSEFYQSMQELDVMYSIKSVELADSINLQQFKTLCLMAPRDSFPPEHTAMLDRYLAGGGNLLMCINFVDADFRQNYGMAMPGNIGDWLTAKGLTPEKAFIIDAACGSVNVVQQHGGFNLQTPVQFPYLPLASTFTRHPVTAGLTTVGFQFASPLTFVGDTTDVKYTPLIFSSAQAATAPVPLMFNIEKKWTKEDFPESHLTMAALLEGKIAGGAKSRLLLISDGDFAINGAGEQARQVNADNINLLINSVDYLSDDTGLISLRTKQIQSRPLKKLDDGAKTAIKYANFLAPVFLIIIVGILRSVRSRNIRNKRLHEEDEDVLND